MGPKTGLGGAHLNSGGLLGRLVNYNLRCRLSRNEMEVRPLALDWAIMSSTRRAATLIPEC